MQVEKMVGPAVKTPARAMTKEAMQQDFDFEMAEKFTRLLHEKGLITLDEMNRISALNKANFSPFYGDIMEK